MSIGHAPSRTRGADVEAAVHERLRSALPADYHLYPNAHWLGRTARNRQIRDGEADLIVAHPDRGILVIETKDGEVRRDARDRWWAGPNRLDPPPHRQAAQNGWPRVCLTRRLNGTIMSP